jgi:hypothetical protein
VVGVLYIFWKASVGEPDQDGQRAVYVNHQAVGHHGKGQPSSKVWSSGDWHLIYILGGIIRTIFMNILGIEFTELTMGQVLGLPCL